MRKTILFIFILLLICNTAFASVPPQQETKDLINKYNETRFKLESGINYRDFQAVKQDLYVKTKLYLEAYPDGDFNNDFNYLLKAYSTTSDIWKLKIEDSIEFLPKTQSQFNVRSSSYHLNYTQTLLQSYPDVMSKCEETGFGFYIGDIISGMFSNIIDKTKPLNQKINASY